MLWVVVIYGSLMQISILNLIYYYFNLLSLQTINVTGSSLVNYIDLLQLLVSIYSSTINILLLLTLILSCVSTMLMFLVCLIIAYSVMGLRLADSNIIMYHIFVPLMECPVRISWIFLEVSCSTSDGSCILSNVGRGMFWNFRKYCKSKNWIFKYKTQFASKLIISCI